MVNAWVSVEMDLGAVKLPEVAPARGTPEPVGTRRVIYAGAALDTPVYDRASLGAGAALSGPALVEQADSTALIWPGQHARVDGYGQLLLGPLGSRPTQAPMSPT
jgi:N-methylhydantoinase A